MAGLTPGARDVMLDAFGVRYPFVSLHSADPGMTGSNELAGGAPRYARRAANWAAASAGEKHANPAAHDVPPRSKVTHVGYWTAGSGGTFGGAREVDESEVFGGQGTYKATIIETMANED